jgi:outer membrane protein OmpA-like peptidoglycan-associated protein
MKYPNLILLAAITFFHCLSFGQNENFMNEKDVSESNLIVALQPPRKMRQIIVTAEKNSRPVPIKQSSASLLLTFETNSAELTPQAKKMLDTLARAMKSEKLTSLKFLIEGHADPRGGEQFNQVLSEKRAEKVVGYLVEDQNIERGRLKAAGKGQSEPLNASNPYAPENRRVTVITLTE